MFTEKNQEKSLSKLVEQAIQYMVSQGYSKQKIREYTGIWNRLQEYAKKQGEMQFSLELSANFMNEVYGIGDIYNPKSDAEKLFARFVLCLDDFYKTKRFIIHHVYNASPLPPAFAEAYSFYETYLIEKKQKPGSISIKTATIKMFLRFLDNIGISQISTISSSTLFDFVETKKSYSSACRSGILLTLRDFLRCPAIASQINTRFINVLNAIQVNRYERMPSYYSNDEIKKILSAIDRTTTEGKKDYAIILIAVDLGLRVSDIINLKLSDIIWDTDIIELKQQKTGEFITLHITDNVKWSLVDYLMHVRPKETKYENVFLRSIAPHCPYTNASRFYGRINKYMKRAGIDTNGKHHGMHSCRYSLATRLMNDNTPITVVSEALGHKYANVTKEYIRIDISQLRLAALEVPTNV